MIQKTERTDLLMMFEKRQKSGVLIAKMVDSDHERKGIKDTLRRFIRAMMKA